MLFSLPTLLLVALSGAGIKATNVTGDPTNIANWPPCAQKCIPLGLVPPASCNSLSNLTCICQNPTFSVSIAACELTTCSTEELHQIAALSTPLCAPVGGLSGSVSTGISSFYATAMLTASTVPTSSPNVTVDTAVSAIQATSTRVPDLGDPVNILTFPLCAQTCNNESLANADCDTTNINCLCGSSFRSVTAACQEISCSAEDRETTRLLSQEVCGPVYRNQPSLSSAVEAAIASATSVAAAVATRDPTKSSSFPLCAQKCQNASLPATGCGSLSNRTCLCTSSNPGLTELDECEKSTCSASDYQILEDLAYLLCNPVGGVGPNVSNTSYSATGSTPTPTAFTGNAAAVFEKAVGWSILGLLGALGWQFLL